MEDNIVPIVALLCIFVAPLWLVLHYRDRKRQTEVELQSKSGNTAELTVVAEKMEQRIDALEKILDTEAPGWRQKHDHT
ncbi:MAG: envelope stress response membrane protein PspB [Stenotrophobium sp.]